MREGNTAQRTTAGSAWGGKALIPSFLHSRPLRMMPQSSSLVSDSGKVITNDDHECWRHLYQLCGADKATKQSIETQFTDLVGPFNWDRSDSSQCLGFGSFMRHLYALPLAQRCAFLDWARAKGPVPVAQPIASRFAPQVHLAPPAPALAHTAVPVEAEEVTPALSPADEEPSTPATDEVPLERKMSKRALERWRRFKKSAQEGKRTAESDDMSTTIDFCRSVNVFSEKAARAAAQSRETLAVLDTKGGFTGRSGDVQSYGAQALQSRKDDVLDKWLKSVNGTVQGETLFGNNAATPTRYSELFDALVTTLASTADPPNDAELISFCTQLMPPDPDLCTDQILRQTVQAINLFEEVASNVLLQVCGTTLVV